MPIPIQDEIVYGPVVSRRLGKSLGINLLGTSAKTCNFDCLYCQYGFTGRHIKNFPSLEHIQACVLEAFRQGERPDRITVAGNGEPTLYPRFAAAMEMISAARDAWLPSVPIAVLSNSSTCSSAIIRLGLSMADERIMKLDAGTPEVFNALNGPVSLGAWERMLEGLQKLEDFTVQAMFVRGLIDNTSEANVDCWIRVLKRLHPNAVQVYTLARPPAESRLVAADEPVLRRIADRVRGELGIEASVFCED